MDIGGVEPHRQRQRVEEPAAAGGGTGSAERLIRVAVRRSGGKDKHIVGSLVETLAKLVLQNSHDLAGLIGATYKTYMHTGNDNSLIQNALLEICAAP